MNICVFSPPFYPMLGGLDSIAMLIATEASLAGHQVEVLTASKALSDSDNESFPFKIIRTHSLIKRFKVFRHADVVLFMNISLWGLPIALLSRTPIVLSHHGVYQASSFKAQFLSFIKRELTRFFQNIAVSQYVAQHLPGQSTVIPNAYDAGLFTQDRVVRDRDFVFCGRLVSDKGADVLLQAFSAVIKSYPLTTLTIIGDGPERLKLEAISVNNKITGNLEFTGGVSGKRLVDMIKKHICMVIPSLWEEPFGIVALEGIACCDTVISSCRGGLPEAVRDCGVLLEPTVDNLTQAMIAVLEARRKVERLPGQPTTEKRAEHLAKHTPQQVAQQYLAVCFVVTNS